MSEPIEVKFYRLPDGSVGKVRIEADDDQAALNPRDNETTGATLVTWERGYVSPDRATDLPAELDAAVSRWAGTSDPVDAHEIARYARMTSAPIHYIGGLTRGGDGSLSIDDEPEHGAGYVGIAVVSADGWRLLNGDTEPTPEATRELAHWEVKRYADWASGEVYGYVAQTPDGETDSCWGYIGTSEFEHMFTEGAAALGDGAEEITEVEYDEALTARNEPTNLNVSLRIHADGAAFGESDEDRRHVVAEMMRDVARKVDDGFAGGTLRDANGNNVGSWSLDEE